ncbi:hypothetical protein Patl1_28375 [Pistacia atlantica]|uniref:Uncharacterized protein n=1 Tax=Pistacia atlantica TaxID=434234 RepID=A0ACC1BCG9_9ROSI|nr:hypothetical protein Patl1_28375 [Pistacia atlantica]
MATFIYDFLNFTFFIFFIAFLPSASSLNFRMPRFDTNDNRILYQGDAVPSVGSIALNYKDTFSCRVPLWNSDTGEISDFSTKFSFIIDTKGSPQYGSGLAFFLAPVGFQIPPNSVGGFLGLFNTTTAYSSSNQIVMVEFDSYWDVEWDPADIPNQNHVGINNNSIVSAVYTRWNASFHSADTADVQITYNATTKNLSVSWTYRQTSNSQEDTSLSYIIDLRKVLPEWVTIGFSAATGSLLERNILESWEFNSSLFRKETDGVNARKTKIIVSVTVSLGVLLIAASVMTGLVVSRRRKRNPGVTMNLTSINDDLERGAGPRKFSYKDLATATNNFSDDRKLGEGGFGAVYKGYFIDTDMAVAVKKISKGSRQGKKEYITEVKTISQLRHRNLVQLIGWCHDGGQFLLVYEFMPNGSLDFHLFGKKTSPLTWAVRYKISLGLASALLYLHEEWEQCVVHRDIKSSNIMLDSSFNVKLGDFGLARLMDHELGPQTTGLAGTLGYLAPEYISTGRASKESDVYSFGVVALEITTGRKSTDPMKEQSEMGLVEWVWDLYGRGDLLLGVDEKLGVDLDEKQVECLMIVGLWCAHPDRSFRPSIRQAIQVLNFETAMPNLPTKMPVPIYHIPNDPSVSSGEPFITNSSIEVGR